MITKPGLSVEVGGFEDWTYTNAQQKVQILDSAPTAAIPLIQENTIGYFNNKIYFVFGGVLKEVALSNTA